MPLDPTSVFPGGIDIWPDISDTQALGTTDEEGDLLLDKLFAAMTATQFTVALDRAAYRGILTDWTPAAFGIGGLSCPSTWVGKYVRNGAHLTMFAAGRVTADWTGPANTSFLELSIPPGMKTVGTGTILETCRGNAYVQVMPAFGGHWMMTPVAHPGANRLRFIHPQVITISGQSALSPLVLAANGVQCPGGFTGDATVGNQDIITVAAELHVEDA